MGRIKNILLKQETSNNLCENRFTVELCENIHVHYRNLRLEFFKEEFLQILALLKGLNEQEISEFNYSNYTFKKLIESHELPAEIPFKNRLQIEEQMEGHFHIHYRNLRIESTKLIKGLVKKSYSLVLKNFILKKIRKIRQYFIKIFFRKKAVEEILQKYPNILIDERFYKKILATQKVKHFSIKRIKLKDISVLLFTKEGIQKKVIYDSPAYQYLIGNKKEYIDYCNFKNPIGGGDIHSIERYENLIKSVEENGFDENNVIIVNKDNEIIDGQHRACMLIKTYGPEQKINVLKMY